jgi:hypothetical protein
MSNTFPIVGMYYRPPAKALVETLAIGTPLCLIAEPDNAYDPNAIAVWLSSADLTKEAQEKLELTLPEYGYTLESLLAEEAWHLGYIPKEMAKKLREVEAVGPEEPVEVTFSLSAGGAPRVRFTEAPY